MKDNSTAVALRDITIRGLMASATLGSLPTEIYGAALGQDVVVHVSVASSTSKAHFGDLIGKSEAGRNPTATGQTEEGKESLLRADDIAASGRDADVQLAELREMEHLGENWDGLGAEAPKADAIRDAIALIQVWPADLLLPEVTLLDNGCPAFEFYAGDGKILGGIDFLGGRKCAYAFILGITPKAKGPASLLPKDIEEQLFKPVRDFFDEVT